ncbi:peptidoglycan-binding protein [Knoellia sinensis KCTC 19936]|uniref:Peptidoglycan-binding protein n=1 Tax=Knoellia sinensis KCTC 19936 TaxID=1385520 RepID=A0A0A0JA37_9MICO|nr:L,D-transpeptidase family protein [Knoellia sinensis]KGN33644.1 peptidoglycan-binding protein [Knoellia sinensis KCTC 19936]
METTGRTATRRAAVLAVGGGGLLTALTATSAAADPTWEKRRTRATTRSAPNPNAVRPTLQLGDTGAHVKMAQDRLNALTYWCGTSDGTFGPLTQQAVWALQKVAHVSRTGQVDSRAWGLLDQGVRANPRTTSGTAIECDLAENTLMFVRDGKLVYTINTSTGNNERYYSQGEWRTARTPTGSWPIYHRWTTGWQNGRLGSMYRPTYFNQSWAIHGSTSIPPYPASHGCCRVSTSAMDKFYRESWTVIGRKVWIY